MKKLVRITTIPLSLEKLLEDQLGYMSDYYEVTAVSSDKERLEKYGEKEGVKTFFVPMTRKITPIQDFKTMWVLYQYLKKERPNIVHTHTPKAGIVGMLAAMFAGVPLRLHTVAGLPLLEAKGFKRAVLNVVEKLTYACATHVYPNSNGLKKIIIAEGFTAEEKLKVLGNGSSNGIDTTYFSRAHVTETELQQKRNELGIPKDHFVFVFVGRIVADKGINELVAAFSKLQHTHPNSTLLLVGPFEDDLDPVAQVTRDLMDTNHHIITTGYQNDVRPFFAVSDALVFPSYREGFPNVVLQAGAMELPAIVSDINGCNEIIESNKNGYIVPVKDTIALYKAMEIMVQDEGQYLQLKQQARTRITAQYERTTFWKILHEEYQSLEQNL